MSRETRISLTEEDFKTLVTGGMVRRDGAGGPVVLCLQDIGFDTMDGILGEAYADYLKKLNHQPVFTGKI